MIETIAFGLPSLVGFIVACVILYQIWKRKKLLEETQVNGTKLLIIDRDLGTVRWLTLVEGTFLVASLIAIFRPISITLQLYGRPIILACLILGSLFVMMALITIIRAQHKLERKVEEEIQQAKGHAVGDVVSIEVTGKVLSANPNKEGGEDIGVEISEVPDNTTEPNQ